MVVYRAEDVRKKCGRGTTTKTVQTRKKACVTELDYTWENANFTPLCDAYKFTKHQGMEPLSRGHNLECELQEEGNSDPLWPSPSLFTLIRVSRLEVVDNVLIFFTGFMTDRLHTYVPSFILAAVTEFAAASLLLILICRKKHIHGCESLESGEDHDSEHSPCIQETNVFKIWNQFTESQMQILLLILGSLPQHRHVLHDVGNK